MRRIFKKSLFFFCILFLCISCTTSRQLLFDGGGAKDIRKDFGRVEGVEHSIEGATNLIEGYSANLEGVIERERSIIEELRRLIWRIRDRGDGSTKDAASKD